MQPDSTLHRAVLDSITEQIAVIAGDGAIVYVNAAWKAFARNNGSRHADSWEGVNYIAACDAAAARGDRVAAAAARGLRELAGGRISSFELEYPCHSPEAHRWFLMGAVPLNGAARQNHYVVVHRNITERKRAEDALRQLSLTDELTGLDNRRHFDRFLSTEWRRCRRAREPLALLLIDVDHFKPFNDLYGHVAGDECLAKLGGLLRRFARRPGDLAVRYGGEEFALILSGTDESGACTVAERLVRAVRELAIPHEASAAAPVITVSVGIASGRPDAGGSPADLLAAADAALYEAKEAGRNRVALSSTAQ